MHNRLPAAASPTWGFATAAGANNINNGLGFSTQGWTSKTQYSARWDGELIIPTTGSYTFALNSDDGSMLFIDGNTVVSDNNYQGMNNANGPPLAQPIQR